MSDLTKKIQNGEMDGKAVWVCHYLQPDLNKKPLRNLPPTECLVVSNDELPKNKTVYYSKSHLKPLNKKGEPTSKVLSPVDNTGYRGRQGNPVNSFLERSKCVERWNFELQEVYEKLEHEKKIAEKQIKARMNLISEKFVL